MCLWCRHSHVNKWSADREARKGGRPGSIILSAPLPRRGSSTPSTRLVWALQLDLLRERAKGKRAIAVHHCGWGEAGQQLRGATRSCWGTVRLWGGCLPLQQRLHRTRDLLCALPNHEDHDSVQRIIDSV